MSLVNILINTLSIMAFLLIFAGILMYMRQENYKKVKGCIYAEFWMDNGQRPKKLYPVQPNGKEIKVPVETNKGENTKGLSGEKTVYKRFFFKKEDTSPAMYPPGAFFKFIQAPVDMVSWDWSNPQPINPKQVDPWVSPEMINNIREDDFVAFATATNEKIEDLQNQLIKSLVYRIKPSNFYAACIVTTIAAVIAAGASGFLYYKLAMFFGW